MQIALKDTFFKQNLKTEAVESFKTARSEDRDQVISNAMSIWEILRDCFSHGAQRKALGHLFDMVQAEKANQDGTLSFDEKLKNRQKAEIAFKELSSLAAPNFCFKISHDATHQMCFSISDKADFASEFQLPIHFEFFDTEKALAGWNLIKDCIETFNYVDAIDAQNRLVNDLNICDKVRHFVQLVDFAKPAHQKTFSLEIASSFGQADLSLKFNDTLLIRSMSCPSSQVEDVTASLLKYQGGLDVVKEEPGYDHSVARLLTGVVLMRGRCFSDDNRAQASKALVKLLKPELTPDAIKDICDELVKLDTRFVKYWPYYNKKYTGLKDTAQARANNAVTKIQAQVRGFITARGKAHKKAAVQALKVGSGPDRRVVAYRIPQDDGTKQWIKMPAPIPAESTPAAGSNKALTHKNDDYVGLTFREPYLDNHGGVVNPAKTSKMFDTMNENIAAFLTTNKLDCIVQQFRVNEKQFISKNLGSVDLFALGVSDRFTFRADQWARLAGQLDTAHAANLVHRDIKPSNMALYNGHVRLFDNDTMYQMATPEERARRLKKDGVNVTTPGYLHPDLRKGKYNEADGLKYGVIVDQYSFINSMISMTVGAELPRFGVFHPMVIDSFLDDCLPCSEARKREIKQFLLNPLQRPLPRPLSAYFKRR